MGLSTKGARVSIPVIGCGGAGSAVDVARGFTEADMDAVACASLFHYKLCPIAELKTALSRESVTVRA